MARGSWRRNVLNCLPLRLGLIDINGVIHSVRSNIGRGFIQHVNNTADEDVSSDHYSGKCRNQRKGCKKSYISHKTCSARGSRCEALHTTGGTSVAAQNWSDQFGTEALSKKQNHFNTSSGAKSSGVNRRHPREQSAPQIIFRCHISMCAKSLRPFFHL